jgi:hypothetical protein
VAIGDFVAKSRFTLIGATIGVIAWIRIVSRLLSNPVSLKCQHNVLPGEAHMKDVYAVLRQKELEQSRLEREVEALRVAAPLLDEEEAENDNQPPMPRAVNETPQPDHSGWQDRGKKHWP